jgi:hypothetical protein
MPKLDSQAQPGTRGSWCATPAALCLQRCATLVRAGAGAAPAIDLERRPGVGGAERGWGQLSFGGRCSVQRLTVKLS